MSFPKPIRYEHDTWLCMRDDPALPKALIRRIRDRQAIETYLVVKWDLDQSAQTAMASAATLEKANALVLWTNKPPKLKPFPGYPDMSTPSAMQRPGGLAQAIRP